MKNDNSKADQNDDQGEIWDTFCDSLKAAKAQVLRPAASSDPVSRAEGWRHLTRLLRISLDMWLENTDPDFPNFYEAAHATAKFGADSPDNRYNNATITGDREYRIFGRLGDAEHFSIGSKANRYATDGTMASTGEISGNEIETDADGYFEVVASQTPQSKNWLPLAPDSSMILVREMFRDWRTDRRAELEIECTTGPATPKPWTPEAIDQALQATTQFVQGSAKTFGDWAELFKKKPNYLDGSLQHLSQKGGGDPNIFYLHGYWKLAEDEALVIHSQVPECLFWNFQLNNWWMESLDYRFGQVALNKFNARYEPDGSIRIIVAHRNPKAGGNYIETMGHVEGTMTGRWVHADWHPQPDCRVVKLRDLEPA